MGYVKRPIPAFPVPPVTYMDDYGNQQQIAAKPGMSLRDYTAIHAMAGLVSSGSATSCSEKEIAEAAYKLADAMMKVGGNHG